MFLKFSTKETLRFGTLLSTGWSRIEANKRKVKLILIVRLETVASVTE